MKNLLQITSAGEDLLGTVDDGTNRLFINDTEIASSQWTGTGSYTGSFSGHTITIAKIADTSGNVAIRKTGTYTYELYDQKAVEYLPLTGGTLTGDVYMPKGYAFGPDGASFSKLLTEADIGGGAFCTPYLTASQTGASASAWTSQGMWYWLRYVTQTYGAKIQSGGAQREVLSTFQMSSTCFVIGFAYDWTDLAGSLPRYSTFVAFGYGGSYIYTFGTQNGEFFSRRSAAMTNWST